MNKFTIQKKSENTPVEGGKWIEIVLCLVLLKPLYLTHHLTFCPLLTEQSVYDITHSGWMDRTIYQSGRSNHSARHTTGKREHSIPVRHNHTMKQNIWRCAAETSRFLLLHCCFCVKWSLSKWHNHLNKKIWHTVIRVPVDFYIHFLNKESASRSFLVVAIMFLSGC